MAATEALVEALAMCDSVHDQMEHAARASVEIAKMLHAAAKRVNEVCRPEIEIGYAAAETIVATRMAVSA